MEPYEKLQADADQRLANRQIRAFAIMGLFTAGLPDDRELDAIEGILSECDQDHTNPNLLLTDSEQNKTYCGRCQTELVPNNNADPTPYSEAP